MINSHQIKPLMIRILFFASKLLICDSFHVRQQLAFWYFQRDVKVLISLFAFLPGITVFLCRNSFLQTFLSRHLPPSLACRSLVFQASTPVVTSCRTLASCWHSTSAEVLNQNQVEFLSENDSKTIVILENHEAMALIPLKPGSSIQFSSTTLFFFLFCCYSAYISEST